MKQMVLWSGGVESTSLLKQLLTDTDDQIFAHYIKLHNPEWVRTEYEQKAIQDLSPLLTAIRPFHYSESEISIFDGTCWPHDGEVQYAIGIMAAKHVRSDRLHRAHCLEDSYLGRVDGKGGFIYEQPKQQSDRFKNQIEWARPFLRNPIGNWSPPPVEEMCPYMDCYNWPKAKHIEYLGDMFQYTHTCRMPVNGKICNVCLSCKERAAGILGRSNCGFVQEMLDK